MNASRQNYAAIGCLSGRWLFRPADRVKSQSSNASPPERIHASAWRLLVASLAFWRPFPSALWLDPIDPRPHWGKRALDLCWLGCVGILFIVLVAPTWQLSYSMVTVPWLERTVLALPLTDLWTVDKEPRLEYVPNLSAPPNAPWLQEDIEDLWGPQETRTSWVDPLQSGHQRYYVDSMMDQGRLLEVPWFRSSGDRPSWLWVFCCTFKNIVPSVRLLLDPLMAWLVIVASTRLLVRHAPSAKLGAQSLSRACVIPVRWAWIGALLVGAVFLVAPDASREFRSEAYLLLLALAVLGPVMVSVRPLWAALQALHPQWAWRHRMLLMASVFLGVAASVVSIDLAARYTGYFFMVKTGRWVGETSNFSLWL